MKMEPVETGYATVITAYGNGGFTVAGERREGSVLLMPESVASWDIGAFEDVTPDSLDPILELADQIDILILGAGDRPALVPQALREHFKARGIAVEAMATGPACRTYNVLLAEHRLVAAALISVE
jgi:uncharacterized protein